MAKTTSQIVAENKRKRAQEQETDYQRNRQSVRTRKEEIAEQRRSPASSSGTQTARQQDLWTNQTNWLDAAREKTAEYNSSDVWEPYPDSFMINGGDIFAEKEWLDYVDKYTGKTYKDTFWGNFKANYDMGRMAQDSALAWNEYLENPTEENRRKAETIDQLMNEVADNNKLVYGDDGPLPWLSKSEANYLPQLFDQLKYQAAGVGVSTAANFIGIPVSWKAGATVGSGVYSYKTMQGAAYKNLREAGYSEEISRLGAKDEAFLSSAIEMADTIIDLKTMFAGKGIDLLSSGGLSKVKDAVAKTAGKNAFTRFATAAAKYGINIESEGLEEFLQEAVSIANERNAGQGKVQLAKDAVQIIMDILSGADSESAARAREAHNEGVKIAAMGMGADAATNIAVKGAVRADINSQYKKTYSQEQRQVIQSSLVEEGLEVAPDSQAVQDAKKRLDKGKDLTGVQVWNLVNANEQAIQAQAVGEQQANETENAEKNSWRNAAEYAKQGDLNAMEAMDQAGLSGSADLALANPQSYARSFQEALKGGASYDQALMQATSDAVMKVVGNQIPMGTLLYNIGGDPNKAVSLIHNAMTQSGIRMTRGELNLFGIVAAEASAYQQDPSFQRDVAIEMLKQDSKEAAWTAASQKLWQEATDRVIAHGIANLDLERKGEQHQQTANTIDGMTPLNGNALTDTEKTDQPVTSEQEPTLGVPDRQETMEFAEAGTEEAKEKTFQDFLENAEKGDIIESAEQVKPEKAHRIFQTAEEINDFFYYDGEERDVKSRNASKQVQWEKSLTHRESKAINDYTGLGHLEINAFLKRIGNWKAINAEYVQQQIEELDSAIGRFELKDNIRVQRGVGEKSISGLVSQYGDDITQYVGKVFHDDGFVSTTVLEGNRVATAKPIIFEIDVPAGVGRGAYVNRFSALFQDAEYEFLLRRGADYTITEAFEDSETEKRIIRMVMNDG